MYQKTLLALLIIMVLIGGGVALYMVLTENSVTPVVSGPKTKGLALFTDSEYGFSLQYPDTYQTDYTFASFYHLPASWRVNTLPEGTGTPLIAVVGYRIQSDHSYPRYFDAEVRIGASKDPKEVARCTQPAVEQSETELPDITLNGTTYKVFTFEDAAMMQYLKGVSYRTVHNGVCIALEQLQTGSSYRDDPASKADVSDTVLASKYRALNAVVNTMAFTQP